MINKSDMISPNAIKAWDEWFKTKIQLIQLKAGSESKKFVSARRHP